MELFLHGLKTASRQNALDAESSKHQSLNCTLSSGWGQAFVAKSLRPLTALNMSRLGRSGRARLQLSCRTDGQGNRVSFPDELPDVRPENRRHGAGLFARLSSKLVKMLNILMHAAGVARRRQKEHLAA